MGKIFYIMGKSSSGKDTIFKEIKNRMPSLKTIVLYTTRPIREGEREGVEYFFTNDEKLAAFEKAGKIIEVRAYDTVHGIWKYATIDDGQIDLEKEDYIVIGTLESYEKMRDYFGKETVIPYYIEVEDGVRLSRALAREKEQAVPKYAEMCRRFLADTKDFSEEKLCEAGIETRYQNVDLDNCIEEIMLGIQSKM